MSIKNLSRKTQISKNDLRFVLYLYENERYTDAIENAGILISHFPQAEELYNIRGAAEARLDRFSEAVKNYQKAIELNPKYAEAYNNLGNALRNSGYLSQAIL